MARQAILQIVFLKMIQLLQSNRYIEYMVLFVHQQIEITQNKWSFEKEALKSNKFSLRNRKINLQTSVV